MASVRYTTMNQVIITGNRAQNSMTVKRTRNRSVVHPFMKKDLLRGLIINPISYHLAQQLKDPNNQGTNPETTITRNHRKLEVPI